MSKISLQVDRRLYGCPRYYFGQDGDLMRVPEIVRTCVAFLSYHSRKLDQPRFAGTTFFVHYAMDEFVVAGYAVTARHVIDDIQIHSTDDKAILRVNEMGGGLIRIDTNCADWFFHPTDPNIDVAVMPISFRGRHVNQNFLSTAAFAPAAAGRARIGIGEEVFITGLFTSHFGKKKN
ncbi:MAG: hypothetical protein ABSH22_18635, partial [Tepidisphaeraceae bacterium]